MHRFVTLHPGDTVLTGTPPGVGCFRKPPLYLKVAWLHILLTNISSQYTHTCTCTCIVLQKGDVVECEIDEIGTIRNEIQ